ALFETGTESLDDMVRCALGALLNEDANTSTLLGWCTGAWLALEIGERLRQSGKEVKVLLVDPPPPVRGNDGGSRSRRFRGIIRDLGASLKRSGRHLQLLLSGPLRSRTRHANHLLRTANLVMRGRRWTPADFDAEEYLQKRRDYSRLLKRAGRRRFSCRVTLLLTAERQSGTHLWVEYLEPPVEIVELPGHHDNFYLEHREELITRINSLLG
ncbi:MAG: alpha/beta fold hydrolase, partial [Candidatus Eremiobacteraeota bacterium]|nr:alpha/beta fold hydrolase [Candidatus Eremiobacteraeota bacterium]